MIKIENTQTLGWKHAIRGMRNPLNSWDRSDSNWESNGFDMFPDEDIAVESFPSISLVYKVGPNDQDLMRRLSKAGADHRKFMRMILVYADITAPLYW